MVVKINGVEIDKSSDINGIEQLQEGLSDIGIDSTTKMITWISELSLQERVDLMIVTNKWTFETIVSFFSFGIL